jgi:putative ABC transport system permease protein
MENFLQDIRYGLRMLRKSPSVTAVAVITLALGIGANTAVFSVVNAVLLHPLPYRDANELVVVWEQNAARGWFHNIVSAANFLDWRKQNHAFADMAAFDGKSYSLSGAGTAIAITGEQVSSNFFSLLGVRPALGRGFLPEDDTPGKSHTAVLSDGLWKRAFGADPQILGKQVTLNGEIFTVIGVAPPHFYFPPWETSAEVWTAGLDLSLPDRVWHEHECIARLRPGVALSQAQGEMEGISARLQAQYPEVKGWSAEVVGIHDQVVGNTRPVLFILLATVVIVLLIACANLANLQLSRVTSRQKEMAIRTALGAGRFRLVRQLLTESLLLAIAGGAGGLVLARLGLQSLVALAPQDTPGLEFVSLDFRVLAFTLGVSLLTGIAFGVLPGFNASKVAPVDPLKESARGTSGGTRGNHLRRCLVVSELALAVILLISAGLLIRSFQHLQRASLGFDPHDVVTMRINLEGGPYAEPQPEITFFENLIRNVSALPGVSSVAALDDGGLPPDGGNGMDFLIDGRPIPPENERPDAIHRVISRDYFRVLHVPLERGRYFSDADNQNSPPVVIINERLARDYWPGRDPVGQRIRFLHKLDSSQPRWFTVVGVVSNIKNRGLYQEASPEVYLSYLQPPAFYMPRVLLVRGVVDPLVQVSAIRNQVARLDNTLPVTDEATMDSVVADASSQNRFPMVLLGLFAGLALALAAVGTYGVLSYGVAQRTQELGIRMALGACPSDLLRMVLRQGVVVALIGVTIGLIGATSVTRFLSALLFGVRPLDWVTFTIAPACLLAVAIVASYVPACRAARVDPVVVLRSE